ncbi:hypothetical protein ACGFIF_18615 [Kribbella sp. NPDC049174]|uniref:hypothetical protein n=1 Tax=Kribbella sp. NPDC049174 TaxID=3364112 RepID=UPI00371E5BE2
MAARTLGFLTGSDPSTGATTSALVQVAAHKREPGHREIRRPGTEPVQVVPATTYQHAA